MILFNIYAIMDRRSKTLQSPFIASSDEIAVQMLEETKKTIREKVNKNAILSDYTVLNLGYYNAQIKSEEVDGEIKYYQNIIKNNEVYDVLNPNIHVKPRHSSDIAQLDEDKIQEILKEFKIIN